MNIWKSYILMKISNKQLNNLAVRRVLVLIQVLSLRSSRQAHANNLIVLQKEQLLAGRNAIRSFAFLFSSLYFLV